MDRNDVIRPAIDVFLVALRKESVDRNINCNSNFTQNKHVALRKESVDRNYIIKITKITPTGRSPQGERG